MPVGCAGLPAPNGVVRYTAILCNEHAVRNNNAARLANGARGVLEAAGCVAGRQSPTMAAWQQTHHVTHVNPAVTEATPDSPKVDCAKSSLLSYALRPLLVAVVPYDGRDWQCSPERQMNSAELTVHSPPAYKDRGRCKSEVAQLNFVFLLNSEAIDLRKSLPFDARTASYNARLSCATPHGGSRSELVGSVSRKASELGATTCCWNLLTIRRRNCSVPTFGHSRSLSPVARAALCRHR
ncbi:hypothetical protein BU26DRAFT_572221 [Trematosphaeria pertusa]|uniref:Uncharacterized protein n=1 Tax=Trematosphaeria pertusa TaxID=390896 RepID=A0A6A6HT80_9PLEO|nr:uncharacterized protein BU26DRAFT_572221 [Trematosphaeria pertusa]KAF2240982.1 hypothetical protein BU26DRAFT_572221 [Trematosphaeria pertusa]